MDPATIIIFFNSTPPLLFSVSVPRFYPHSQPIVKCLDKNSGLNNVMSDGTVLHRNLCENWTALGTLSTVIEVLRESIVGELHEF